MPRDRMRMRPWLEKMIDSRKIDGVAWLDKVRGFARCYSSLFKTGILLKTQHFHSCFCRRKQCSLFPGSTRPDMAGRLKKMPACSRCGPSTQVSNSSPVVQTLQEQSEDFDS